MILKAFRVQMYKSVINSGWIKVEPLTVLVGKNESGKTTLLKALHKFNPFNPEPYSIPREWPRGRRKERNDTQVVCTARFELTQAEIHHLKELTNVEIPSPIIEITRDYAGRLEVLCQEIFPNKLHPNDIDAICESLPIPTESMSNDFSQQAQKCIEEAKRLAHEGRFTDLAELQSKHTQLLNKTISRNHPSHYSDNQFMSQYTQKIKEISQKLSNTPSIQEKFHDYIIDNIPSFIYMSDYRTFKGAAQLDQVKEKKKRNKLTEEDRTLITIMELAGLDLDEEVSKGGKTDIEEREQRQYDLDDASATLTREISDRWKQRRYEVEFRADGQLFYTFVKDENDPSLIRLEERSKGFQWFFSFDLMFMYESNGDFQNCIILLDEPGIHLHPDAQKDLLKRLEAYADENTLIYTTHLPFMIDLQKPEQIRVLSESKQGTIVTEDLTESQPEAKFVLQAALGMSGSSHYLLAQRNLVVEGVDDFWFITELSNLLKRSGETGLPDDVFITPAGGASEAVYIATLMIGQKLGVVVLLDSDPAGYTARDKLVKNWLTLYQANKTKVFNLGEVLGVKGECSIEDLFTDEFYLEIVKEVYNKKLTLAGVTDINLSGDDQLCKRVERFLANHKIKFNKGSVAKKIRAALSTMKDASDLPEETLQRAKKLIDTIVASLPPEVG